MEPIQNSSPAEQLHAHLHAAHRRRREQRELERKAAGEVEQQLALKRASAGLHGSRDTAAPAAGQRQLPESD